MSKSHVMTMAEEVQRSLGEPFEEVLEAEEEEAEREGEDYEDEYDRERPAQAHNYLESIELLRNYRDKIFQNIFVQDFDPWPLRVLAEAISFHIKGHVYDHDEWLNVEAEYGPLPYPGGKGMKKLLAAHKGIDPRTFEAYFHALQDIMEGHGMIRQVKEVPVEQGAPTALDLEYQYPLEGKQ